MKKILLVLIISLTTSFAIASTTAVKEDTQSNLDNYILQKSTSGLEILKSEEGPSTNGLCDNPSSGCYTGFVGGCLLIGGTVVYCLQR